MDAKTVKQILAENGFKGLLVRSGTGSMRGKIGIHMRAKDLRDTWERLALSEVVLSLFPELDTYGDVWRDPETVRRIKAHHNGQRCGACVDCAPELYRPLSAGRTVEGAAILDFIRKAGV